MNWIRRKQCKFLEISLVHLLSPPPLRGGRKVQIPGVYIFTHKITGAKYVGSSSQLATWLYGYLKERHRPVGQLIPLLKDNLSNFRGNSSE